MWRALRDAAGGVADTRYRIVSGGQGYTFGRGRDFDEDGTPIDRADLEGLVEKHPWIAYRLMRAILRFTHGLQRRMSMQSAELMHYLYKNQAKY